MYEKNNERIRITGKILNGDWDICQENIELSTGYKSFKQRFIEGKEWEKTDYYKLFKYKVNKSNTSRGFKNWKDFKKQKLYEWDKLYEDIKENGYREQKNIRNGKPENEIEVCISRHGKILLLDGKHRLSITKILDIEKIPVIVNVWHKKYIDKAKKYLDKENLTPKEAIKPIIEEDLDEIL